MSEHVPEKRPKQTLAAAGPAAPADDTPPLSLKIYSRCGTSAGTHTAATRDGRGLELKLQHRRRTDKGNRHEILDRQIFRVTFVDLLDFQVNRVCN